MSRLQQTEGLNDEQRELLKLVREFVNDQIIPVATELPEKVNSILWIRKRKDTLAFGNITGAMVFQGTLLPAIGIALTPWVAKQKEVLLGVVVTLAAAFWLRWMALHGGLKVWHLFVNGALYATYLTAVLV